MYSGTGMLISPSGPLICTVAAGLSRPAFPFPFIGGAGSNSNETSGGTDSGARPIFEAHRAEEVKVRDGDEEAAWKAGRRKDGRDAVSSTGFRASALRRQ